MAEYRDVPVSVARDIAERYLKSQVVVLVWDSVHEHFHTTTYGIEAADKAAAANLGQIVTAAAGGDLSKSQIFEDYTKKFDAAFYKESLELLAEMRSAVSTSQAEGRIEKFLKRAGFPLEKHPRN